MTRALTDIETAPWRPWESNYRATWRNVSESTTPAAGSWEQTSSGAEDIPETIYMYLDESGDFDFGEKGAQYFIMSCVVTKRPFTAARKLGELRYDLIEQEGFDHEKFHACEDRNPVRERVFELLARYLPDFSAYSIKLDKKTLPPEERNPRSVYSKVFELILSEVKKSPEVIKAPLVIVITDDLPISAKKSQVVGPLKKFMKEAFTSRGTRYVLLHQKSCSDPNLQIADYLCWAYQKKYVHGNDWAYSLVAGAFREVGEASYLSQ